MTVTTPTPRQEMIEIIARIAGHDGDHPTIVPGLSVHRDSSSAKPNCAAYKPSLAIIVQGAKRVVLGGELFVYGASDYLLTSIDLPVLSQISLASSEEPYLSMNFQIDTAKDSGRFSTGSATSRRGRPPRRAGYHGQQAYDRSGRCGAAPAAASR